MLRIKRKHKLIHSYLHPLVPQIEKFRAGSTVLLTELLKVPVEVIFPRVGMHFPTEKTTVVTATWQTLLAMKA